MNMTKKLKMGLVAATLLLLPCMAFATAVSYSTSGSVSGATFITYKGVTKNIPASKIPAVNAPFGTLHIHCKSTCATAAGATLTVTITQTLPGPGNKTLTATLSGTFTKTSGGGLTLVWSGPAIIKAGGFATIYTPTTLAGVCSHGNCTIHLKVAITQVALPLPEPNAELLLGLGTLGLIGLTTLSRKMIST